MVILYFQKLKKKKFYPLIPEDLKIRFNVLRMAYLNIMSNYFYDFQDESNEITKTNAIEGKCVKN